MRTCTYCKQSKPDEAYSWADEKHHHRDSRCKRCRAIIKKKRYKPKHSTKQYTFYMHLSPRMYDEVPRDELIYVAGLFDGEGCITTSLPKTNQRPLSLKLSMIHKATVEGLHKVFGGSFGAHRTRQPNARQSWWWNIAGVRSYTLLKLLLPFLRVKRDEAEIGIELGETLWDIQIRGKVTEETLAKRRRLAELLHDLKRRDWL